MNLALRARLIWGRTFGAFMGFASLRKVGLSTRDGINPNLALGRGEMVQGSELK